LTEKNKTLFPIDIFLPPPMACMLLDHRAHPRIHRNQVPSKPGSISEEEGGKAMRNILSVAVSCLLLAGFASPASAWSASFDASLAGEDACAGLADTKTIGHNGSGYLHAREIAEKDEPARSTAPLPFMIMSWSGDAPASEQQHVLLQGDFCAAARE
jgi:hypothetical protein